MHNSVIYCEQILIKSVLQILTNSQNSSPKMNNEESTFSTTSNTKHKVVFLGNSGVGKTTIIHTLKYSAPPLSTEVKVKVTQPTMMDIISKDILHRNKKIRLQLWDTAGQEKYHSLVTSSIRDHDCAILVYDVSDRGSFEGLTDWEEMTRKYGKREKGQALLLANKVDKCERIVTQAEGFEWALRNGMSYLEVSGLTGAGIQEIVRLIMAEVDESQKVENSTKCSENAFSSQKSTNPVSLKNTQNFKNYKLSARNSCCSV